MAYSTGSGARALRDQLRSGEISATEATTAHLARITERTDLGAFITVTAEAALDAAAEADRVFAACSAAEREARLARLHGLPLAHKDLVDVAGVATTHGSAAVEHRAAPSDDPGVAVLRAAGSISLGKTQVPEFGLTGYSENLIAAPARNPLSTRLTPGGSSGGSAAAVAAGLVPVAPGSDGGGSIRIPALACGLVGLKTGRGAISTDVADTDSFGAPRLTASGPIARDAADAAMLFDAMCTARTEPALSAVRRADKLQSLGIGVTSVSPFASEFSTTLSPDAERAFNLAAERLLARGHRVAEADVRYDPDYPSIFTKGWTAGLSLLEFETAMEAKLAPLTRAFRDAALSRSPEDLRENGRRLREFAADVTEQWGRYDVVLMPGLVMEPPTVGAFLDLSPEDDYGLQCEWAPYTSMVNVSGLPAVAVPVLRTANGLSMGVQLVGRAGSEIMLLQLAEQLMHP
ncbi:MAG: amidase [Leucobacter sp.]